MKKKLYTFCCLLLMATTGFCETYYWVGGTGPTSFTSTGNWNTQLNGGGVSRSVAGAQTTDVLIFDGSNIGGATQTMGNVTTTASTQTNAQLILQNGANVTIGRTATGSATITLNGATGDDFVVDATSTLNTGGPSANFDVFIVLGASATGLVSGTVYLGPLASPSSFIHLRCYITAVTANSLVFASGSACHITDSTATSGFNGSVAGGVLFKTGSSLYYYSGRSPIGSSSTVQITNFEPGSNLYMRGSNVSYLDGVTAYSSSSWINAKTMANVYVQNGASLKADGPTYKIENLGIDNACNFTTHTSGNTPVLGNVTVDGTGTLLSPAASTNVLVLGGNTPQTISGTGTISIASIAVANYSEVILNKTISVASSCNIVGKLNFGATAQISGTATFTSRLGPPSAANTSITGNSTAGSFLLATTDALSSINGLNVSGPGLSPNTNVIGFGTGLVYISKPALSTTSGTYTFDADSATLVTANPNGMDTLTGSMVATGTKSFQAGTNYIINAATSKPFGISSGSPTSVTTGSVTLNAPITTNYNLRLTGTLTMNSGNLTIRPVDTLRISSGYDIAGAPFSSSKYIICGISGSNVGVLRMDNFAASKLLPIGTASSYLPVTLAPASSMNFATSAFAGVTTDGTPTGTQVSAGQKANIVDATWVIDRVSGSGDCALQLGWPAALEGSMFAGLGGAEIGIGHYNGTEWEAYIGSGNNTTNIANANFSNFSPFTVGRVGFVLPLQLKNIAAQIKPAGTEITWSVLQEESNTRYSIEKSLDGTNFSTIGSMMGSNRSNYSFIDASNATGKTYYRLSVTMASGRTFYSNIVVVQAGKDPQIGLYPNPVVNSIVITGLKNKSSIKIINTIGQIVSLQTTDANTISIDASDLKAGMYMVEVSNSDGLSTTKPFIKQ